MSKTIIIAEAGVNHNGSKENAKKLIDAAAAAGADYVKFQTFKAGKLVSSHAKKARYQQQNINDGDDSQLAMIRKLELSEDVHYELFDYCKTQGIKFLSTGFDEESIDFLEKLGIDLFKIPSGEITNKPYLQHIAGKGKPVILSTGMATIKEIEDALAVFSAEGLPTDKITVLHCNTEYPTPMNDVNLRAMLHIKETFHVKVGYSDHTLGIEVPVAAVALGAAVIEKHFTLDRNLPGPDHKASHEPNELLAMVKAIRNTEKAISGSGLKGPTPSEIPNIPVARKSIHYAGNLEKGHIIAKTNLVMKRPGDGISPMEYEKCLGKSLRTNVQEDQMLKWEDLE
jgi:N,N'-diacetyllegionaminate synthase